MVNECDPSNCMTISLTRVLCLLQEHIVTCKLSNHFHYTEHSSSSYRDQLNVAGLAGLHLAVKQ